MEQGKVMDRPAVPLDISPPASATALGDAPLDEVIQHLRGAICICDANGYITHYNDAAAEVWGRRPQVGLEQWSGAHRLFLRNGTPLPHAESAMALCVRDRKPYLNMEAVCERPDESRRLLRLNLSPIFDSAGSFRGALNEMLDITEFEQADKARSHLAAIINNSDDAIISTDLNGIIQTWNDGAQRLFGYVAEEMRGKSIAKLVPPHHADEERAVLDRIRRGDSVEHYESIRQRKDGSLVDLSLTVSPIYNSYRQIIGASKIARDITVRKRAERELAEAERRKDEFIATLAHELRNPLTPLTASLELIRMADYDGRRITRTTLRMMERQVRHLNRLVGDFLDLTRLTHGKIVLRKEPIDTGEIVGDAVDIVSTLVAARQLRLDLVVGHDLFVNGDRIRLVQILANLLNNAAKFARAGGRIQLVVDKCDGFARVRVRDDGVGIAPENLEAIFGMFSRVSMAGASEPNGMGIGLALVRKLVDLHGGSVRADSEGLGKGAEFTILLPLAIRPQFLIAHAKPAMLAGAMSRRILVVDDNADAVMSIQALLTALGHEVRVAGSAAEALNVANEFVPDVVILDIGLPDMSGYDLAARLRGQSWGEQAVLVALSGRERDPQRSQETGIDHHILKPIDLEMLESAVASSRADLYEANANLE